MSNIIPNLSKRDGLFPLGIQEQPIPASFLFCYLEVI